jgi:acetyl esterase/lipase
MANRTPDPHSEAVLGRPSQAAARSAPYGKGTDQVYDVHLPTLALGATVLVVHGGFWRAAYDRTHAGPMAAALADAGFHVAVAEYRRGRMPLSPVPALPTSGAGAGVVPTLEDIRNVVATVRADAELPDPLVLVGHSAGGQLVAWTANQPWADGLAGVVALAGCVDLGATDRRHLGRDAARQWLAGTPEEVPERWAAADPVTGLPPRCPVRLLHGREDREVPVAVTEGYLRRCRELGADVTLEVIDGAGHYSLIDPEAPAFDRVLAALRSLMGAPGGPGIGCGT